MQLPESQPHLEDAEAREKKLQRQVDELKQELDDLSYAISHDLRAPLRAVHGFTNALREDYEQSLDAEGQRYLTIVIASTRQMSRMIEGILTLSRLGRQRMEVSRVSTQQLVDDLIAELKGRHLERQIDFKIGALPDSWGDPVLLRVVWSHLLANAVKFTASKPVACIEINGSENPAESVFSVKDNGVGFDMKYESKLFGLFQRFHSEKEFEGTGVGLAVVQRLVRRHGGRAWAESMVNEGTTVSFAIPRLD